MKEYAVHVDERGDVSVIEKNKDGHQWSTYIPNAGSGLAARRLVVLLNTDESDM